MSAQFNALPALCPDLPKVSQCSLNVALDFVKDATIVIRTVRH